MTETNPLPTDRATVREAPLREDLAVCAGCGGKVYKLSLHFYERCSFCGSRKLRRNSKRPQVCRMCVVKFCRYIPEGKTTCTKLVKKTKPVSKTRLARAGKGLHHLCFECQNWKQPQCRSKRGLALACNKFVVIPPSLPSIEPAALAQCNPSGRNKVSMKKSINVTLLRVSPLLAAWIRLETGKMQGHVGAATLARAVLEGVRKSKVDLSSAAGEEDITALIQTLLTTATTTTKEVK